MGAFQSITENFVWVVKHIPLIVFVLVLVWFILMTVRNRWWKVAFLIFFTPRCQAFTHCSQNEFSLCTSVESTIESKYHILEVSNQTVITKFVKLGYYFNLLTLSNCTGNDDFDLVESKTVRLLANQTMGCKGGWIDNNYFDTFHCRNASSGKGLRYHGPFKTGNTSVGFWVSVPGKGGTEYMMLNNLTFRWRQHDYSKQVFDLSQNFSGLHCLQQKQNCTIVTSSSGTNSTRCLTVPLSVLHRQKRSETASLTSTTSFISLISLDTGYSDSTALWQSITRIQDVMLMLESIVANLSANQAILAGEINIDQKTIKNILGDLQEHGLKLTRAEKSFNNTHLCVMRNESHDLTHFIRINHTYSDGSHFHDCKSLILVNDSLSGLIHLTKLAHQEALEGMRLSLLRSYLLTLRWEYPCVVLLIVLGVIFVFLQGRAEMHRHYKKGEDWKCPFPHYPNNKGVCSCGKKFDQVMLCKCPIEKY
ncbi:glycoprotein precursor [big electron-dense squares virus 1]|uniref:Glycoprotein n=1 Tax=big electron-dense squares virus 1 TaxID=3070918 RepID=A0AA46RXU5_9VIRU|nr:glycoprotein precursor [big electron-dense squares virus 1]UVT34682.1 glycoprotein precursor [big electron-dense squares virus 1]